MTQPNDTTTKLSISVDEKYLQTIKDAVVRRSSSKVKLPGFRSGKAPAALVEKNLDQSALQSEVLEEAVNKLYVDAITEKKLRPVERPKIELKKFVPFTVLEFEAEVPVVGEIKLADYTKLKQKKSDVSVEAKDVTEVLKNLQTRQAERKDADREARDGDQVWIDFAGADSKGVAVNGAEGKDYPLVLGSKTFIPGFEEHLVGMKAGEERTFTLTFPKDYGVKALADKDVTFAVTVTKVQEIIESKLDDAFAAKVGPFKSLSELKTDIKKQLYEERQQAAERDYEQALILEIVEKSDVSIPQVLIDEQMERMLRELKQNLTYRGLTYEEFLAAEKLSDEEYRDQRLKKQAEERVKAGLLLTEIAEREKLTVTPDELEMRVQLHKGQHQDAAMQSELDKPENRREIAARMLTEKTIARIVEHTSKAK